MPLTSKKGNDTTTSHTEKEKATSIIGKNKEKTPPKKVNQAESSSTVEMKEKSHGEVKKKPTPGTHRSPRIRVNLAASVSATPTEEAEQTPNKSKAEMLDFDVD